MHLYDWHADLSFDAKYERIFGRQVKNEIAFERNSGLFQFFE